MTTRTQRNSAYEQKYRNLRVLIKRIRKHKNLTQEDIAERLQETQSFVSKVERGERRLDAIELMDVLEALGVDAVSFFNQVHLLNKHIDKKVSAANPGV